MKQNGIIERFDLSNESICKKLIKLCSFYGEKVFHTSPSGIDSICSFYGGITFFKSFLSYKNLSNAEINKDFHSSFKIFLIDTTIRRNTKSFIEIVSKFKNNHKFIFENAINSISYISNRLSLMLQQNDSNQNVSVDEIELLINTNQKFLEIIQVSNFEIEIIVLAFKRVNIPVKITGAGGGGFLLALVNFEKEKDFLNVADSNVKFFIK